MDARPVSPSLRPGRILYTDPRSPFYQPVATVARLEQRADAPARDTEAMDYGEWRAVPGIDADKLLKRRTTSRTATCCAPQEGAGLIYKITSPSGKAYIGQTRDTMKMRLCSHCSPNNGCHALRNAIRKYGMAAMKVEILMEVPIALLSEYEAKAIATWQTYGKYGYNLTPGGEMPPLKCPEIAAKLKLTMAKPEVKAKLSAAQKRNHAKPGAKEKRSAALKAAHANPETSARFHAGWKAAQSKEENKEKQRVAQRKAHKDPAIHKARMAGLEAARKDPAKQKARADAIREANKRDPGINKRRIETLRKNLAARKAAGIPRYSSSKR